MKIILRFILAVIVFSAATFVGGGSVGAQVPSGTTAPPIESVVIPVKGMSCMACVAKTKQALRGLPGVSEVEVKLSPGSAVVKYDPAKVTPEKLATTIRELGYEAGSPAAKGEK